MLDYQQTVFMNQQQTAPPQNDLCITIFDGMAAPVTADLAAYNKNEIYFGRAPGNDIMINSSIVSGQHGRFVFVNGQWSIEDKACYQQQGSSNGLICNGTAIYSRVLCDGDLIRIDDGVETIKDGVLLLVSSKSQNSLWAVLPMGTKPVITIGRDPESDIVLPHVSVSKCHATIAYEQGCFYIEDNNSTNGVIVNNHRLFGRQQLHEKDVINITNSKLIFTSAAISYCCYRNGISVDVSDVVITRGKGKKKRVTGNNINMGIKPGELVAVIGGSGAGKSTVLNCMCGYLPPESGDIYINGVDLYRNFDSLKKLIGYVPQSDIVYDNLTLYDMLSYTAKLRLPKDSSGEERECAIQKALETVELTEKKNDLIKSFSGGQRKRASIAVELLSDPNLLYLDEPSSGLDPATERSLMESLRRMANDGKTVILVTHSTLQLKLCDKIAFMGKGGNLCFLGGHDEALRFFNVNDIVDVYQLINDQAPLWRENFDNYSNRRCAANKTPDAPVPQKKNRSRAQLPVLCSRYAKLIVNDKQRLLLLLVQAPILALLISLVANETKFVQYESTKGLLFALSCAAFWVGMLNSIQEVCKERTIVKREYMTGLSMSAYVLSKIVVLCVLSLVQSVLMVGVFGLVVGTPDEGVFLPPLLELLITTFLTSLSAAGMGIFVSCLFNNSDRAMTTAPILLMPQIIFSGLIFKLEGATEKISWFTVCRWSMEGYGSTANLNSLESKILTEYPNLEGMITREAEDFFEFTTEHMITTWGILLAFTVGFLILARIALIKIAKN